MNSINFDEYQKGLMRCYENIDIGKGDNLYVTGNLGSLGRLKIPKDQKLVGLHKGLCKLIGEDGSIFSTAASMNLCNTDIPFDKKTTPSHQMGPLAEYFRTLPNAKRSLHPFWSISGSGPQSVILDNVSRHAYGVGSPWSRFLELNVRQVNFGLHPSKAVTLVHHLETVVGVPYRYCKEFNHPVVMENEIKREKFYMSVMYRDSDIEKKVKLNEHFFESLDQKGLLNEVTHESGLKIWSFMMRDFFDVALGFFIDDIYTYLEQEPKNKPYTA